MTNDDVLFHLQNIKKYYGLDDVEITSNDANLTLEKMSKAKISLNEASYEVLKAIQSKKH